MPIRDHLVPRSRSILLGLYSGLGLLMVLLKWGIYNEFYAQILGDRVGAGIFQTAIRGLIGGTLVFLMVFLTTNAATKWRTTKLGSAGALAGLLNTSEVFGISAAVFYVTPYLFGVFQLAVIFVISGVVGVSTYLSLYDWRLSDVRNLRLKLQDLKFVHDDSLKSINLIAWASIVFVTGGVVAGLTTYSTKYELGSPQEIAAKNVILLFLIEALFIGVGIWLGWIAPYFGRLEAIRLELRKLDVGSHQHEGADAWGSEDRSQTCEQTS
jgi:hypothetical protein